MKRLKRVGLIACTIACLISFTACFAAKTEFKPDVYKTAKGYSFSNQKGQQNIATVPVSEEDAKFMSAYEKIAENPFLELFLDRETTFIAVADKRTGKVWYSNSPKLDEGSVVEAEAMSMLKSQLMVDYIEYQAFKSIDNYTACILNKNFTIQEIKDGVSITYTFMEAESGAVNTESSDSAAQGQDSKTNDEETAEETTKETSEQFRKLFDITLEYTLDNESLIANVPLEKIQYSKNTPPLNIMLLQDFGSSNAKKDGYLFVPDGSGALIRFDSNKMNSTPLKTYVYGIDKTIDNQTRPSMVQNVNMPVFGLMESNNAFLAIIEDGAAFATISAYPAGVLSDLNEVFSSYNILSYQNVSIGVDTKSKFISVQDKMYQGNIRVRYAFLNQPDADYVGMAKYYQSYLIEKNAMSPLKQAASIPLNVEIIGSIDKIQSFFGINYDGVEPLTTFDQAQNILQDMLDKNIRNINVKYDGWFNGGLNQEYAGNFHIEKALGGNNKFQRLVDFTKQNQISLYPNVKLMTSPSKSKGFNKYQSGAKVLDQKDSRVFTYDNVALIGTDYRNVVKHSVVGDLMKKFYSHITKYGVNSLSVDEIGSEVFADYTEKQIVDRQTASNFYNYLLKEQKKQYERIMVSGANDYAVNAADIVLNAPLYDSRFYMTDESVPFFSIVYHGYKEYSSTALNLTVSHDDDVLKSLEYGALPYYQIMYADGSVTKNTQYSNLCSNNYGVWKDKIVETYSKMNNVLADVYSATIVGHQKLAEKVYETTYSNGTVIIVNYNDMAVKTEKGKVEARGYIALKGVK